MICEQCGKPFERKRGHRIPKFCSLGCFYASRRKVHVCPDCGGPRTKHAKRCNRCHLRAVREGRLPVKRRPQFKAGWHKTGRSWTQNLTREQIKAVQRIRVEHNGRVRSQSSAGWTVFVMPTTLPARYVELRHHLAGGRTAKWVLERDGSVSAHNDQGQSSELIRL